MSQATRRKTALIIDQLTGTPGEATNGVPPTRAALTQLMLRRSVPLLAVTTLAALMWRTSKQIRCRTAR
ncbi:hypothetical protein [Streptomyces sp. NPDC093093]|uniref:hypothetical protein n=1 Tax=Streptomyces sp. NPDC093093 TaxID=3366025 RepID=UPI0037F55A63